MAEESATTSSPVPLGLLWTLAGPEGGGPPWADSDRWLDRMLAACSDVGIEGVHAGLDPAAPARSPRLMEAISRAARPPKVVVLVVPPLVDRDPERGPVDLGPASQEARKDTPRERSGRLQLLLEVRTGPSPGPEGIPESGAISAVVRQASCDGWGFAFEGMPSLETLGRALERRPGWIRFPVHLLSPTEAEAAIALPRTSGVPIVASDPFAGGLLDGSRLRGSPLETSGRPAPSDWAAVRRAWAPVLALGFLTEGHQRSLSQAALQYVLGTPGVAAVLVPAADPSELMEAAVSLQRPDLSAADRARVRRQRAGATSFRGSAHSPEFK